MGRVLHLDPLRILTIRISEERVVDDGDVMSGVEDGDQVGDGDVVSDDEVVGASLHLEGLSGKGELGQRVGIVTVVAVKEDVVAGGFVAAVGLEAVNVRVGILGDPVVDVVNVIVAEDMA